MRIDTGNSTGEFLSTLSLRRATSSKIISSSIIAYFYPRSPCGERQSVGYSAVRLFIFLSTLSLRRATAQDILTALNNIFLSTLSLRRATTQSPRAGTDCAFLSTLSLRRATIVGGAGNNAIRISIHALLAESDRINARYTNRHVAFLSTLSLRRATRERTSIKPILSISIHALLAESDVPEEVKNYEEQTISIHALLAESDSKSAQNSGALLRI